MEIEREENIFYNLIKNETSLTEVFCNFMRYESFRNLFIDMINEKIKNKENIIDKKYHNRLLTRACFFVYSFLGLDITNFREG